MKKKIIGIAPTIWLYTNDDPYEDRYQFVNNYIKRIYDSGAIAIGLLLNDGKLNEEVLDICDAFLLPGGFRIDRMHYQIMDYAYKNNKPLLGICMGMQVINTYLLMKEECEKRNVDYYDLDKQREVYDYLKENDPLLGIIDDDKINNHLHVVNRTNFNDARHKIKLEKESFIYDTYKKELIDVVSLHKVEIKRASNSVKITARALDGVIEAIEVEDKKIYGVQYHPEIDDIDNVIKEFIKKVGK